MDALWPQRLRRIARASLISWRLPALVETAELLLTELATNALRHAHAQEIGVRMYVRDGKLVIEVRDGSPLVPVPRSAGADDENGRGLLLVEALADSWGVSPDGTTTWCSLSLVKSPSGVKTDWAAAPLLREALLDLPATSSAVTVARVSGRTKLTMLDWPGNGHAAIAVLSALVDNAVTYGLPEAPAQGLSARLGVTEAEELVIDVTDPNPKFPDFTEAVSGTIGRGLWHARQHGAQLSWFVPADAEGKTVRATLRPGRVEL
ncbi:ATP-binding protein [Streptomyces sp. KLOTTS4A1]|uniref:ATP-binding protein n=1 Tax=Streptomyces sp. KLOTTS4A1 TaxID=3390996 RepID=UPI0039F5DCCD